MNDTEHDNLEDRRLVQRLQALPRSLDTSRDLWPEVQRQLPSRRKTLSGHWGAIAATVAIAVMAVLFMGRQDTAPLPAAADPAGSVAANALQPGDSGLAVALLASEKEYQAAFQVLLPLKPVGSASLNIKGAELWRGWSDMRQTEAQLLAALDQYPDNVYLGQKLVDLRGQQLQFMRQVYRLERQERRRT